jgi:hypothetical protein
MLTHAWEATMNRRIRRPTAARPLAGASAGRPARLPGMPAGVLAAEGRP